MARVIDAGIFLEYPHPVLCEVIEKRGELFSVGCNVVDYVGTQNCLGMPALNRAWCPVIISGSVPIWMAMN